MRGVTLLPGRNCVNLASQLPLAAGGGFTPFRPREYLQGSATREPSSISFRCHGTAGYIQGSEIRYADSTKQVPSRARQNRQARAGTNFTKPHTSLFSELCTYPRLEAKDTVHIPRQAYEGLKCFYSVKIFRSQNSPINITHSITFSV